MQFTVAGSRIICSRRDHTVEDEETYRRVVEFDANVDKVPPHVAARLTRGEIQQLSGFLADRQRISANSAERNMLEALPGLLAEAAEVLDSVDAVNASMYEQISSSIDAVRTALEKVRPEESASEMTRIRSMRESEAQKERLRKIGQYN
jgi:hypothetical protein